jgi:hypothetical protein
MSDVKNGSVGKLKLSNEMKEKLEAVTGSRKNSIRSNASSSKRSELEIAPETIEVRKLSENRKLLMEQKLGGGNFSLFKDFFIFFHFFHFLMISSPAFSTMFSIKICSTYNFKFKGFCSNFTLFFKVIRNFSQ